MGLKSRASRGRRAALLERELKDRREREAARYVLAVLEDRAPDGIPPWMAPALAVWVVHATAETFVRSAETHPAAAMEKARRVIAATAEGK